MKHKLFIWFWLLIANCLFPIANCSAQWINNAFEQKVFVENKGQFGKQIGIEQEIFYQAKSRGVSIYFTRTGLTYCYDEMIPETAEEKALRKKEKKERMIKVKNHRLAMKWLGGNGSVEVVATEKVSFPFIYGHDPAKQKEGIRANAYEKITYRNIYPGIDAEYVLPDKGGVKYNLVLHPGADPSLIKMMWSGESLNLDKEGNLIIKTSMGDFVDHAPQTFYAEGGKDIPSSFNLTNNIVSFHVSPSSIFPVPSSIIIDPWTTNPNIPGYNAVYDVDYDFARNVYAYGGDGWTNPFEFIKMNSAGAIQWVFVTSVFSSSNWYNYYGDFVVDGYSQSVYLAEGMNTSPGSRVIKLNPAGTQVAMHPGSNLKEIWRMAYNSCTKQGVLGGSGWDQPYEAALFDTTLAVINAVHMLGPQGLQDLNLLAIDNSNNCFMGFQNNGSSANNQLLKCPVNTLAPNNYLVGNDFEFAEVKSMQYVNNGTNSNGMNGMAVNSTDLYTYNGYKVKRHNKNTGAVVDSAIITPPQYAFFSADLLIFWAGIDVDECNNIFIGSHDTIFQLDINLNKVGFIVAPNTVFDLKLSPTSDTIYVAGKNFVSSLNSNVICNGLNINTAVSGSCASSSATVTATGGTAPYTYLWNPGGQTGQVVSGLATGTYTVTVWDSGCPPIIKTATVAITSGSLTASISPMAATCLASNGSATVTPTGGSSPFTYNWSPTGGNSSTASGLAAGTYSVTITDSSGCSGISTVTIATAGGPTVSVTGQTSVSCNGGNNGTAAVAAVGGSPPYTYVWNPPASATGTATGLSAGNYSVTITDASGCAQTQVISITAPTAVIATASATPANCGSNDGTASAFGSGGTTPYTYNWSTGQTTASISNLASGSYSVTITDANGCTQTASSLVMSSGGPTANVSADVTITVGNSTTLAAGGGGTYAWSNGDIGSPIVVAPSVTTVYCVTVTDTNNCIDTACVIVYIETEPITSCESLSSEDAFVLPSAFSPNMDGQNDKWRLLYVPLLADCVAEFQVAVYSRWGELVFEGTTLSFVWDGMYREKMEGTAVFAYYLHATMKDGTEIKKKGNITLLR